MRFLRCALSVALILQSSQFAWPQQTTSATQSDPQALAVLTQMIAVTGWSPVSLPQDAVAAGTLTRFQAGSSETLTVTWKGRGAKLWRTELQNGTVTIVNGDRAVATLADQTQTIPTHAAISIRPMVFPFFSDLAAVSDPSVSFIFAGTETVAGQPAYRIELTRSWATGGPLDQVRRRAAHLTVWLSGSTGLPVQVQYPRIANDNPSAIRLTTRVYSDYRVVNGLAVPFHQEEYAGNALLYSLQLTRVQFNVGLTDADFALPATQP